MRAETVIFVSFWLLLLVAGRSGLFQDPGVFWHTVVGEQMIAQGELVRHDSLSFTFGGRPWIAHQWLGECLMAGVYRVAGWDGLLVGAAALLAALFAWVGSRLLAGGITSSATAILLGITFLASAHHFHVRPHLASMVGMALGFGLLCDVDMRRRRIAALGWLLPLFAVWTNLHGGALGGLATITLVFAGWGAFAWLGLASPVKGPRDLGVLVLVWIGCVATLPLNPYGWQMFETWMAIMQMSLPGMIVEHGRPDPRRVETWMLLLAGAGYLALLSSVLPRRCWQSMDRAWRGVATMRCTWLVVLVWLVLASDRVRHVPLAALLVAIVLPDLLTPSRWRGWLVEHGRWTNAAVSKPTPRARQAWLCPMVLTSILFALAACGSGTVWAKLSAARWPVVLTSDLQAITGASVESRRIFNALDFGGFVAFHAPQLRIFIDDRCELYRNRFLRDYFLAETKHPERIDAWHAQYHFQHALVRTDSPFDRYLTQHADWQTVRRSPVGTLYRYKQPD